MNKIAKKEMAAINNHHNQRVKQMRLVGTLDCKIFRSEGRQHLYTDVTFKSHKLNIKGAIENCCGILHHFSRNTKFLIERLNTNEIVKFKINLI